MLLLLFGFPLIAFINSYFFTEIFKKYIPKEEDQEHSNGISPLLDEKQSGDRGCDPELKKENKTDHTNIHIKEGLNSPLFLQ